MTGSDNPFEGLPPEEIARLKAERDAKLEAARRRWPGGTEQAWKELGYDISQTAARLFEALPERFTWGDVVDAAAQTDLTEEDLRAMLRDYAAREMVTSRNGLYAKSGFKPYRTDLGNSPE